MSTPIEKFPYGSICASIWANTRKDQPDKKYYSIRIERSYRDEQGNWQNVDFFFTRDLPDVIAAADDAYRYLRSKKSSGTSTDIADDEFASPSREP